MKLIKVLALTLCVAAFAVGCASTTCCPAEKPACTKECCANGKADCATCPTCTPKK